MVSKSRIQSSMSQAPVKFWSVCVFDNVSGNWKCKAGYLTTYWAARKIAMALKADGSRVKVSEM